MLLQQPNTQRLRHVDHHQKLSPSRLVFQMMLDVRRLHSAIKIHMNAGN